MAGVSPVEGSPPPEPERRYSSGSEPGTPLPRPQPQPESTREVRASTELSPSQKGTELKMAGLLRRIFLFFTRGIGNRVTQLTKGRTQNCILNQVQGNGLRPEDFRVATLAFSRETMRPNVSTEYETTREHLEGCINDEFTDGDAQFNRLKELLGENFIDEMLYEVGIPVIKVGALSKLLESSVEQGTIQEKIASYLKPLSDLNYAYSKEKVEVLCNAVSRIDDPQTLNTAAFTLINEAKKHPDFKMRLLDHINEELNRNASLYESKSAYKEFDSIYTELVLEKKGRRFASKLMPGQSLDTLLGPIKEQLRQEQIPIPPDHQIMQQVLTLMQRKVIPHDAAIKQALRAQALAEQVQAHPEKTLAKRDLSLTLSFLPLTTKMAAKSTELSAIEEMIKANTVDGVYTEPEEFGLALQRFSEEDAGRLSKMHQQALVQNSQNFRCFNIKTISRHDAHEDKQKATRLNKELINYIFSLKNYEHDSREDLARAHSLNIEDTLLETPSLEELTRILEDKFQDKSRFIITSILQGAFADLLDLVHRDFFSLNKLRSSPLLEGKFSGQSTIKSFDIKKKDAHIEIKLKFVFVLAEATGVWEDAEAENHFLPVVQTLRIPLDSIPTNEEIINNTKPEGLKDAEATVSVFTMCDSIDAAQQCTQEATVPSSVASATATASLDDEREILEIETMIRENTVNGVYTEPDAFGERLLGLTNEEAFKLSKLHQQTLVRESDNIDRFNLKTVAEGVEAGETHPVHSGIIQAVYDLSDQFNMEVETKRTNCINIEGTEFLNPPLDPVRQALEGVFPNKSTFLCRTINQSALKAPADILAFDYPSMKDQIKGHGEAKACFISKRDDRAEVTVHFLFSLVNTKDFSDIKYLPIVQTFSIPIDSIPDNALLTEKRAFEELPGAKAELSFLKQCETKEEAAKRLGVTLAQLGIASPPKAEAPIDPQRLLAECKRLAKTSFGLLTRNKSTLFQDTYRKLLHLENASLGTNVQAAVEQAAIDFIQKAYSAAPQAVIDATIDMAQEILGPLQPLSQDYKDAIATFFQQTGPNMHKKFIYSIAISGIMHSENLEILQDPKQQKLAADMEEAILEKYGDETCQFTQEAAEKLVDRKRQDFINLVAIINETTCPTNPQDSSDFLLLGLPDPEDPSREYKTKNTSQGVYGRSIASRKSNKTILEDLIKQAEGQEKQRLEELLEGGFLFREKFNRYCKPSWENVDQTDGQLLKSATRRLCYRTPEGNEKIAEAKLDLGPLGSLTTEQCEGILEFMRASPGGKSTPEQVRETLNEIFPNDKGKQDQLLEIVEEFNFEMSRTMALAVMQLGKK